MKSTILAPPPQEAIFPIALELYFNLQAGKRMEERPNAGNWQPTAFLSGPVLSL